MKIRLRFFTHMSVHTQEVVFDIDDAVLADMSDEYREQFLQASAQAAADDWFGSGNKCDFWGWQRVTETEGGPHHAPPLAS